MSGRKRVGRGGGGEVEERRGKEVKRGGKEGRGLGYVERRREGKERKRKGS